MMVAVKIDKNEQQHRPS